jgi:hypothetical protein
MSIFNTGLYPTFWAVKYPKETGEKKCNPPALHGHDIAAKHN